MTPEERRHFQEMQRKINAMYEVADAAFIANLERRLNFLSDSFQLSDATDVSTTAPSNGQVLKYNGTQWAPGTDNT